MSFAVELRLGDRRLLLQAPVQRVTTESERLFHPSPLTPWDLAAGVGTLPRNRAQDPGIWGA